MRATLRAGHILCQLRGMHHVGIDGVDIDLTAWLARSESIELLDENAHKDVARAFFVDMLSHATKSLLFASAAEAQPNTSSASATRARRAAHSRAADRQAIVIDGEVQIPSRLMQHYSRFILRMHPLVFVARQGVARPHARLDYRLALVVHCGQKLASINQSIVKSLDLIRKLRRAHAELLGGDDCPARLFLIVWRDEFHPLHGRQKTQLQTDVQTASASVASEHLSIEMHNVLELQYNATQNDSVPRHIAVTRDTEPGIATIRDAEFPGILLTDPQVKLHDFRLGQILRIERRDIELGYDQIDYRIVRPAEPKAK